MKNQVLKRWFWTITEYLMLFPAILIISVLLLPDQVSLIFTLALPVNALISILIARIQGRFRNIVLMITGTVYTLLVSGLWFLASPGDIGYIFVYIAGTAVFFYRGIKRATGNKPVLFFYAGGLLIHIICYFLISRVGVLVPYLYTAAAGSALYVIAVLPIANRYFLIAESQQKNSLNVMPSSVVRGNRIIVMTLLVTIGILSAGRYLLEGINWLIGSAGRFINWLSRILESAEDNSLLPEDRGDFSFDMMEPAEENPVVQFILEAITALLVLFLLFLVIRHIVINHKRIIKSIMEFFSRLSGRFRKWSSTEQSYSDKYEFLLKTADPGRPPLLRRILRREKRWKDMKDNISRTRFIYTRFVLDSIQKGFQFRVSDTPLETVERISREIKGDNSDHSLLSETYDQARYGNKEISDETVMKLKDRYL